MISFAITGPKPPPGMQYRQARERALRELQTRADTTRTACPDCGSGIYDADFGYCPSCGFERTTRNNVHPVQLDQRSADMPCGVCGGPFRLCLHGYQAQGRY
jgi:ribosomal protein L37E